MADKPHLIIYNNWTQIITPNDEVRGNMDYFQEKSVKQLGMMAQDNRLSFSGYAGYGEGAPAFRLTPGKTPLLSSARRTDANGVEMWTGLRTLLESKEIKGRVDKGEEFRLIIATPFNRHQAAGKEKANEEWVRAYLARPGCKVKASTLVAIGGETSAEAAKKRYINPSMVTVVRAGYVYGQDAASSPEAGLESLPGFLRDAVLAPQFPAGSIAGARPAAAPARSTAAEDKKPAPPAEPTKNGDSEEELLTGVKESLRQFWAKRAELHDGVRNDAGAVNAAVNASVKGFQAEVKKVQAGKTFNYLDALPDVGGVAGASESQTKKRRDFMTAASPSLMAFLREKDMKGVAAAIAKARAEKAARGMGYSFPVQDAQDARLSNLQPPSVPDASPAGDRGSPLI